MKKILTILIFSCVSTVSFSQCFNWEKIDSVPKSKNELYSDIKLFIAETWVSSKDVIQNDDKEAGLILVRGNISESMYFQMNDHDYRYSYTVKFYMKDQKYRLIIENVVCESAICGGIDWPRINFSLDNCIYPGYGKTSLSEARYNELKRSLQWKIERIVERFQLQIKQPSTVNEKW